MSTPATVTAEAPATIPTATTHSPGASRRPRFALNGVSLVIDGDSAKSASRCRSADRRALTASQVLREAQRATDSAACVAFTAAAGGAAAAIPPAMTRSPQAHHGANGLR
jgi:hypothetical protein